MNIAITGPDGLIGSRIIELLANDFTFIPLPHHALDITHPKDVQKTLLSMDFDILLHLAAYTQVDAAETEKEKAHAINVKGTKNLFDVINHMNKHMIYISTDFVFDGIQGPFDESSTPNPIGFYGKTKYQGEQLVVHNAMIVRISYPYHSHNPKQINTPSDIVTRLTKLLKQGKPLTMVTDAAMTPTHIDDIAQGLKHLMNNWSPSLYHLVGSQSYTPFEIGTMIADHLEVPQNLIQPTTFEEYSKGKAPRPQYSDIRSIKNDFHPMRSFGEGLPYLI